MAQNCIKAGYNVPADQWLVPEQHKPDHDTRAVRNELGELGSDIS